jgi:hypothetical protein
MSLKSRIEANLNKILDFRINNILAPVSKKIGAIPVAGVVMLAAFTSASTLAANNPYPSMNNGGKQIPSAFTPKSSSSAAQEEYEPGTNKLSSMYSSRTTGSKEELSEKASKKLLEKLAKKGYEVVTPACATATYKMIVDSENASKFSMREKIIAANFIQPFLANNNDSLLIKYASAIDNAQSDYTYNWDNFRRDANNQTKSLRTDPYESSTENTIEKNANLGAKAIFDSIGFHDTSEKLQKKIDRIEKSEKRAEQNKVNSELRELDREVSFILTNVSEQLKSGKVKLDFTSEEARVQNKQFYDQIVGLINPDDAHVKAAELACAAPQMGR